MNNTLPSGSSERKAIPLYEGVLKYFPAALAHVAYVSKVGNDKHNPGEPMHHAREKSTAHADCIIRHLIDLTEDRGHGVGYDEAGMAQVAYIAWRALALAQEWLEKHAEAPRAPGATPPTKVNHGYRDSDKATHDNVPPVHEIPCHWCGAVGDEEHGCGAQ